MTYHRPTTHAVARSSRIERLYDKCACGRWKEAGQYVCLYCEDRGKDKPMRYDHSRGEWVTVVSCPGGEFDRGAQFQAYHFELTNGMMPGEKACTTIEMGNWPEGMVVEFRGKRYVVVGEEGEPQRLEEG